LPTNALEGARGPLVVVNAESNALAITKIELGKIAMEMLLAAMLVHALHAALEDRVVALDRSAGC
jgi:hypothetical protein